MNNARFKPNLITSVLLTVFVILAMPAMRFGIAFDLFKVVLEVPDGGLLAVGAEDGIVRQRRFSISGACCARDPGKDFNTLDAAGNSWPGGIWSGGMSMRLVDCVARKLYAYNLTQRGNASAVLPVAPGIAAASFGIVKTLRKRA